MRTITYLTLLLLLALALASCAALDARLELRADGSGARTMLVLVDEAAYNLALATGADPLAAIAAAASQRGATVEPYAEYARRGLRLTQSFDRLGDIPALPPLDDVRASRQSDWLGTHYALTITVDAAQLLTMTQGLPGVPVNDLELTYHVTLPGHIRAHNADAQAGNTLAWTLDPGAAGVRTLEAASEVPHDLTAPYLAGVAGLGALGLALVGALALANARRRRRADRVSSALSGCLGLALLMAILACLGLALLTGWLALEGRLLTAPMEDTMSLLPTTGALLLTPLPDGALALAILAALSGLGLLVLVLALGGLAVVLHRRDNRAAPLLTGCLGGVLGAGLLLCLTVALAGGYAALVDSPTLATPTAIAHVSSPSPGRTAPAATTPRPSPTSTATPPRATATAPATGAAGPVAATLTPWHVPTATPRPTRSASSTRPTPVISHPVQDPAQAQALIPAARADLARLDDPPHYTIDATLDPAALLITGRAQVQYTNNAPVGLAELYFNLYPNLPHYAEGDMPIDQVTVEGQPAQFEVRGTALQVALPAVLAPEAQTTLVVDYRVQIPRNTGGYGIFGYNGPVMNLAHWYPILAVYDEAGWHVEQTASWGDPVYSPVGLYDVRLTAPASWTLATSGVLTDQRTGAGGVTYTYVSGPMRDFAIAASDRYVIREQRVGDTVVRAHYMAEEEADARRMLEAAAATIECHNQRFGNYPFVELDVCAVDLAGAAAGMEFPGLVYIGRNMFMGDADILSLLEFVVAHEVGHEWWFATVGSDPVNHPWLDEGLTNYAATLYFEHTMDQSAGEEQLALWMALPYASYIMTQPDLAVDQPVSAFPSDEAYSAIVYGKGGLFFWKLRQVLGDEAFFRALHRYYQDNKYRQAQGDDLLRAIQQATGQDVTELYENWIVRANGLTTAEKAEVNNLMMQVTGLVFRAGLNGRD